jgi:hypothetical protein
MMAVILKTYNNPLKFVPDTNRVASTERAEARFLAG